MSEKRIIVRLTDNAIRSAAVKRELSQKARLSVYQSIYAPTLVYGHELLAVAKTTRLQTQVVKTQRFMSLWLV